MLPPTHDTEPIPDDPALHPERNEEDELLDVGNIEEPVFRWDLAGRLRKLIALIIAPKRLFQTLADAPDIFTPLFFLTVLGFIFLGTFSGAMDPLVRSDVEAGLAAAPLEQLSPEQAAGLPEQITGLIIWSAGAIGVNHILLSGIYAFFFLWLTRYLGFHPKGYPELLSIMAFVWLPRPIYVLIVDAVLISSGEYTSWNDLKHVAAGLYPGAHVFLPAVLDFREFWSMAAFYLLGPIDLFLILGLVWLYVAAPYVLERPEPRLRLMITAFLLFVALGAFASRAKISPDALRDISGNQAEIQALQVPRGEGFALPHSPGDR